jgi:parvulin-like peptidyl-prolyl isomerase
MSSRLAAIILSASLLTSAASVLAASDAVLATYNGGEVKQSEVEAQVKSAMQGNFPGGKKSMEELSAQERHDLVRTYVTQIVLQKEVSDAKLEEEPKVKEQLEALKRQFLIEQFLVHKVKAHVTEKQLKDAYNKFAKENASRVEAHVQHILVKTEEEAKKIAERLKKGEAFEALAKELSIDSTKENGGDLGFIEQGRTLKEIDDVVFKMKEGKYSNPVKTDFGWHVIKLIEKRKVKVPEFKEVRQRLEHQLGMQYVQGYVEELLAKAKFKNMVTVEEPKKAE